jgi:hypothetical protein
MKVNCLSCGHNVVLDDAYNDFEGMLRCYVCSALLEVKTSDGKNQIGSIGSETAGNKEDRYRSCRLYLILTNKSHVNTKTS